MLDAFFAKTNIITLRGYNFQTSEIWRFYLSLNNVTTVPWFKKTLAGMYI